ncbi:MAG: hypothetical protein ACPL1F_06045, partial [bacterium]
INKFISFFSNQHFNNNKYFSNDVIYMIFKKINNMKYKDYRNYNFSILFSNSFFNGTLYFKDLNNYKLFSNYSFRDINFIKQIYLKNILINNKILGKVLADIPLLDNLELLGNIYLTKDKNNFDFTVFSLLNIPYNYRYIPYNLRYETNILNDFFIAFQFRLNNLKFINLNILADIFDNYFSVFSKNLREFSVNGFILDSKKLISYNFLYKLDFSFNFDIFNKKINNFYLFIDKLYLDYRLFNENYVSLFLDKFFIKYQKPFNIVEFIKLFNNKKSNAVFIFSKYFMNKFLLNNKTLILGNINLKYFYYKNKKGSLNEFNLFTYKLFNDNLKIFANIFNNFSNLIINLNIISNNKNYVSKGVIYFDNKYFLFNNLYANFDIDLLLNSNSLLINSAHFNGNFLINNRELNKNNLFNFAIKIEELKDVYLLNLVLNYNIDTNIDYFKFNLLTTIYIKDFDKGIKDFIDLFKLNIPLRYISYNLCYISYNLRYNNFNNFKFSYSNLFNKLLSKYNKVWQKTYFTLAFDNKFLDILSYLKINYGFDFLKFIYLKDYKFNLIKTPEIFSIKLDSINNNALNFNFNLSSNRKDTFLYLNYVFDKFKIFNFSFRIDSYSLLYLPNLLSINNKNIDLSFNIYSFSINLISIYFDMLFKFSFFYDFSNAGYMEYSDSENSYNIPIFSFNYNGSVFIDSLKKISKIKINSIKSNINLKNLYVFTFNKFKIIDLSFNNDL